MHVIEAESTLTGVCILYAKDLLLEQLTVMCITCSGLGDLAVGFTFTNYLALIPIVNQLIHIMRLDR